MVPIEFLKLRLRALQEDVRDIDISEPWHVAGKLEDRNWDVFVLRMDAGTDTRLVDALNRIEDLKREVPQVDWGERRPPSPARRKWMARVHAWAASRRS